MELVQSKGMERFVQRKEDTWKGKVGDGMVVVAIIIVNAGFQGNYLCNRPCVPRDQIQSYLVAKLGALSRCFY